MPCANSSAADTSASEISPPQRVADALTAQASKVQHDLCEQEAKWSKGFTRRKFLAGAGMVSVAALANQLVTTRVSYASTTNTNGNVLISIFMRGAADGLRILVPATSALGLDYLNSVRASLVPASGTLVALPNGNGWAMNSAMAPLLPFWNSGEMAFVPAVSAENIPRSHFQAQQIIERGGDLNSTTGWLDRALTQLGPGTTFRAVAEGDALPGSLAGPEAALTVNGLSNMTFPGWNGAWAQSQAALAGLYRSIGGTMQEDVTTTLAALSTAATLQASAGVKNGAVYPSGDFASSLADLATMIRGNCGLQIATVDVGGWDTHTNEASELDQSLAPMAQALAAFMTDLGPTVRSKVTIVVTTEFGRRVAMNASGGTDHGHGSVMWLLGGGITGGQVYGQWQQLSNAVLDQGDVPGLNNAFDVYGELLQKRFNVGSVSTIFPSHSYSPLNLARTT